ncbi:type I-E CRISPR-associated protein Cas5/CasD [Erwinia sp. MMLR14_017]|uniref:type I-E CRISPR-associated protein Cas5/CasD n=1 Tax=Erwinia sp. MMLR14_017 TaxID=3093842 RepID=UPI00298F8CFC|nr:type I-E CRISPR-associated protein Cas5/CasD [Erwinia sp. MMLR14_017]MDW8844778.1 type I-E CRISPR-associated protein Cas5/CasD [Erwinia sp. MMLR14_017]
MQDYLILQLAGPMQFWGLPTFEGIRPCAPFPTRSGLLGLLGACLGIKRNQSSLLQKLAGGTRFAVRCDDHQGFKPVTLTDFHTVKEAREQHGGLNMHDTIITRRDYLCDASFSVAVWTTSAEREGYTLRQLSEAVIKPVYTPYLGRRSCPLSKPLFRGVQQAADPCAAFDLVTPGSGAVYSEEPLTGKERRLSVRDEPLIHLPRQFGRRNWYVIQGDKTCS